LLFQKAIIQQNQQEHQLIRELEIHMRLFHKHILRMYDFFYDSNRIYVILEYAANDTLASYLKHHQRLDNTRTATFIYQIADALNYCHRLKIMHRDLKPENILLGQFHEVKLADFGLALHCPSSRRTQYIGTMDYMAPEVIENEDVNIGDLSSSSVDSTTTKSPSPYEESADLWSLGIIAYELLVGSTPFYDPNVTVTKKRILSCDYVSPDYLHSDAGHLINHLIKYDRQQRLTIPHVFEHNFIRTFAQINFLNETFHHFASMHHSQNNTQ
jgi:serine/threonine protein kinase